MKQLTWTSLSPYAIYKENAGWFSGRVMDILIYGETVIIATAFGGIWAINTDKSVLEGFVTTCLTDEWDDPNVNSLAHGPDNNVQLYAGCEKTFYYAELENGSNGTLMRFSTIINLPVPDINTIHRIVVQKETRRIILATGAGVWWSSIPPDPKNINGYAWKKAAGLIGDKIPGLCKAAGNALHASVWGSDEVSDGIFGIFKGVFQGGELQFTRSKLNWSDGIDEKDMTRVSLASCSNDPAAAFAVCSKHENSDHKENFRGVLKYDAAKDEWSDNFASIPDPLPGGQGGFNNCIAVAPDDSSLVAFGWQKGTYVLVNSSWKLLDDVTTHHDIHGLLFTGVTNGFHNLYVGSDGGILKVTAPKHDHPKFDDRLNVFLPTLLFKDDLRRAYATTDVSPVTDGLISGGLQDNGVKYLKTSTDSYSRWLYVIGADGGTNTFLANGVLISRESNPGNKFKSSEWNIATNAFNASAPIPLPVAIKDEPRMEICTRIPFPVYRNKKNQLMHAVSAAAKASDGTNILLGLFSDNENAVSFHWEIIGTSENLISAAASVDGKNVFVATGDGKLHFLDVAKFISTGSSFSNELKLPDIVHDGSIVQFEIVSHNLIFALYAIKAHGSVKAQGYILVYNGLAWSNIPTPVSEAIYSIAADWADGDSLLNHSEKKLFFSTDDAVYQGMQTTAASFAAEAYEGTVENNVIKSEFHPFKTSFTWEKTPGGLPARRSHFNHLRTGWDDKKFFLYASTYGRSVYRAELRAPVQLPGQNERLGVKIVAGVVQDGGGMVRDPQTGKLKIVPPRQD